VVAALDGMARPSRRRTPSCPDGLGQRPSSAHRRGAGRLRARTFV